MTGPARAVPETAAVTAYRVGPGQELAADSSFGNALTGLWHAVSEAGGSVGFVPPVERAEVATRSAPLVDELRHGKAQALALIAGRALVGFGALRRGGRLRSHTGSIVTVMVHPDRVGQGLGGRLMTALIELARADGLDRVDLSVRDGEGLDGFYRRFGFVEWGRRPGWIRVAPGDDRDEVFYLLELT